VEDKVLVESVIAFIVLLTEEVVDLGAGHNRGGLESYPTRMLFTADW